MLISYLPQYWYSGNLNNLSQFTQNIIKPRTPYYCLIFQLWMLLNQWTVSPLTLYIIEYPFENKCVCVRARVRVRVCEQAHLHTCTSMYLFVLSYLPSGVGWGPFEITSVWAALAKALSHTSGQSEGCWCCSLCTRMELGSNQTSTGAGV